jgi:MarR family transcriptional regulator, organic hydroperoxide resistance regulator
MTRSSKTPVSPTGSTGTAASGEAAPPEDALALDRFICFSLYAASHAFNRVYKPLLDELGLTYPQYLVMVVLWEQDDRTVGAIGEALSLDSNTLTPLLKRLEAAGLLDRTRDKADERQVRVRLTNKGRMLREKASKVPQCLLEATGFDPRELATLNGQLGRLRQALNDASRKR